MFVDYSLIDSIVDSSFAKTADTGCDWLEQLQRFTAVLAETKQFQNCFVSVSLNCADSLR